ncbi:hypothetical protein [Streptomyces sp. NPDC001020]
MPVLLLLLLTSNLLATHWTASHGGPPEPHAPSGGLRLGPAGAAVLAAVGTITALTMLPRDRATATGSDPNRRAPTPPTRRQHTTPGPTATGSQAADGEAR